MSRRFAVRILLSLVLLLSQQMALSHALTHFAGGAHSQQTAEDSRLSSAVAQDQSCDQCLSFAQLAGTVGSDQVRFAAPGGARLPIDGPLRAGPFLTSHPPFLSRAPPLLG